MKIKNLIIDHDNQEHLERLREEYRHYCGFDTQITRGRLTVFSVPRAYRRGKKQHKSRGRKRVT